MSPGALSRPGAVAADIEGRLAVSDTGNHRVLVGHAVGPRLDVLHVVGSGEAGWRDGPFAEAAFREPRGLALSGDMLIVADRGNHAIRMVDLSAGHVGTMAGTGEPAVAGVEAGDPLDSALSSPWDVLLHEYDLYVAMAGTREVWRLDLKAGTLVPHAGPAGEGAGDGSGAPAPAPLALADDGARLYAVDAAVSGVRAIPFEEDAEPRGFGGPAAALEGPGGLAWGQGNHRLWVADTGHDRLMLLDPSTGALEAVDPFEADLARPSGLASAGHLVFVADTDHDRVLRVDQVDKRVVELEPGGA